MPTPWKNTRVRQALLQVVENQIRGGDPPETRAALERLMKEGKSRDQALELISKVVEVEMEEMLQTKRTFNRARFTAALNSL